MSTDNSLPKHSRYPNLGNLTIAIIEHIVEPVLGKDAIKELKTPYENRQLYDKLRDALIRADREFLRQSSDLGIPSIVLELQLSTTDELQDAFWNFVENPASLEFRQVLHQHLRVRYPNVDARIRISIVNQYLQILRTEIVNINPEMRQKINSAVLLSLHTHVESIDNTLASINSKLGKMIDQYVERFSSFGESKYEGALGNERESRKDLKQNRSRLDFELKKTLGELNAEELGYLYGIMENWIPPLVEQHIDKADYERPYGTICGNVIETLSSSVELIVGSPKERRMIQTILGQMVAPTDISISDDRRYGLVSQIFKSKMLVGLPEFNEKTSIYLKSVSTSLTKHFPQSISLEAPYGFYLVDMRSEAGIPWLLREFGLLDSYRSWQGSLPKLVFVSRSSVRDWKNAETHTSIPHLVPFVPDPRFFAKMNFLDRIILSSQEGLNQFKKKIKPLRKPVRQPQYYYQLVTFTERSIQIQGLEANNRGYLPVFDLDMTLTEYAAFMSGFMEDFSSMASKIIISERQAREYNQNIINQLKK